MDKLFRLLKLAGTRLCRAARTSQGIPSGVTRSVRSNNEETMSTSECQAVPSCCDEAVGYDPAMEASLIKHYNALIEQARASDRRFALRGLPFPLPPEPLHHRILRILRLVP